MTTPLDADAARPLFSVQGLTVGMPGAEGRFYPACNLNLEIGAGETVALVGESGTGKSLAARAMIGLLPPEADLESGVLMWEGKDLARMPPAALAGMRAREIAFMPEESADIFDPFATVGTQLASILRRQTGASSTDARGAAAEMLRRVGVTESGSRLRDRADQLSAATRRRVLLAMALICKPRLLIADEPTRGLDKVAEADILALLAECRREWGMAILMLSNDISAAARLCDRMLVMYGGRIVETGHTREMMSAPRHPYTRGLVASIPRGTSQEGLLPAMSGDVAPLTRLPTGCAFHPRCPEADPACLGLQPLRLIDQTRRVACWRAALGAGGTLRA